MTDLSRSRRMRAIVLALRLALVALFLWGVARHYDPVTGFTEFLVLPADGHEYEVPALQALPHYHHPGNVAHDGQMYVQLALDPLVRDPATDRAMDIAPYRARRILFSWTAYLLGAGRPAWIVLAYTLQNIIVWLLLAWWLARQFPADDWRGFAVWVAVMFTHGLLASVWMALLDGPTLLIIALATAASVQHRSRLAALLTGLASLGRETSLLAAAALGGDLRIKPFSWSRVILCATLVAAPLLLWVDYLRAIYLDAALSSRGPVTWPFMTYADQWQGLAREGVAGVLPRLPSAIVLISLTVQALYLAVRPRVRDPWWRLGAAFAPLLVFVNAQVWEGNPGSVTRVVLPLTLAYNILITKDRAFWAWLVAGNLPTLLAFWTLR